MRPIFITKQLAAAVSTGICTSQSPGAGAITLNGSLVVAGVANLITQRQVIVTSGGDDSGITFTITGTNDTNVAISETITGGNAAAVASTIDFLTVTSITHTGAVAGTITAGTNGVGCTHPVPLGQYQSPFNTSLSLEFPTSGSTATAQYTYDDVFSLSVVQSNGLRYKSISSLTDKTADADGSLTAPVAAVRMKITAGTAPVTIIVRQAGLG
jgi:hypothetical protein